MALPDTIAGVAGGPGHNPPHKSSGGNYYAVNTRTISGNPSIAVWKSTAPGSAAWSIQDPGNDPVSPASGSQVLASCSDGTYIHIVSLTANDRSLEYHRYNMSTDSWEQSNNVVSDLSGMNTPLSTTLWCSIALRAGVTGDELVIAASGLMDSVMGSVCSRVDFWHGADSGTPSWTGPVAIDGLDNVGASGADGEVQPMLVLGTNNKVHVFYNLDDGADGTVDPDYRTARTIPTGNTPLSTKQTLFGTIYGNMGLTSLVSFDDSGTQRIAAVYGYDPSNVRIVHATEDGSDNVGALSLGRLESLVFADSNGMPPASLVMDGVTPYLLYSGGGTLGGDQDLYISTDTDVTTNASFGTSSEELDAVTINFISAAILDSGKVAYLYDDGGTTKYNEYTLPGGATEGVITFGASGGVAVAAEWSIEAAFTTAAQQSITSTVEADLNSAITVGAQGGISTSGGLQIEVAFTVAAQGGVASSADVEFGGSISVGGQSDVVQAVSADFESFVNVGGQSGISADTLVDWEVSFSVNQIAEVSEAGNFTTEQLIALAQSLNVAIDGEIATGVVEGGITLSGQSSVTAVADVVYAAAIALGQTSSVDSSAEATMFVSVALAADSGVSSSGGLLAEAAFSFGGVEEISPSVLVDWAGSVELGSQQGTALSIEAVFDAALSLDQTSGVTEEPETNFLITISVDSSQAIGVTGEHSTGAYEGAITLSGVAGISAAAGNITEAAITLAAEQGIAALAQNFLEASIAVASQSGLSVTAERVVEASFSIGSAQDLTDSVQIDFATAITLDSGQVITVTVTHQAEVGIVVGAESGVAGLSGGDASDGFSIASLSGISMKANFRGEWDSQAPQSPGTWVPDSSASGGWTPDAESSGAWTPEEPAN